MRCVFSPLDCLAVFSTLLSHSLFTGGACSHLWAAWLFSQSCPVISHLQEVRVLTFGRSGCLLNLALPFPVYRGACFSPLDCLIGLSTLPCCSPFPGRGCACFQLYSI
ncbi:hypothetical protein BKA82DRAFT_2549562 [Pisolithus tinctorius]|nr:hypothetical protein BKA82DRAFT_2549562 [Pisolithus tinctorius]